MGKDSPLNKRYLKFTVKCFYLMRAIPLGKKNMYHSDFYLLISLRGETEIIMTVTASNQKLIQFVRRWRL